MRTARFWTGIAILMSPATGLVIANSVDLLTPCARVEGRVTYQGRPLRGGMICLATQDHKVSGDMIGRIDRNGHFACEPRWCVAHASPTRFRILLYPDPRGPTYSGSSAPAVDEVSLGSEPVSLDIDLRR